jgi:FkbM family methyltransferase
MSKFGKKRSFPVRAVLYGLRTPGRLFNRFVFYPMLDRKIASSDLELIVHDQDRGLMRVLNYGERLDWSLDSGKACDAVPWLDRIEPLIHKDDLILDVGANMGVVSLWLSQRCDHVHAFEPHPENIAMITSQMNLRNSKNITLHQCALGKEETEMQLHVKNFHGHHSLGDVDNSPTVGKMRVKVQTMDDVCKELNVEQIQFLKIDVEGFESDVLLGGSQLLAEKRIDYILFELQETILHSIQRTSQEVFQILFDSGYEIIDLNGTKMEEKDSMHIPNGDYLACINGIETAKKLGSSPFDLI